MRQGHDERRWTETQLARGQEQRVLLSLTAWLIHHRLLSAQAV